MSEISSTTGSTGSGGGNMIRITGLNTGLDVDALVEKMLKADQTKIDQVKQQQQLITWKQEAYQDIISDIKDLQNTYFDVTDSDKYLLTSNNYNNMTVTSSDSSVVTAKASADAAAGTYKIKVSQVAESATIGGESLNSRASVSYNKLSDWTGKVGFTVDGSTYSINLDFSEEDSTSDEKTSTDLVAYINKQISSNSNLNGKVSASVVSEVDSTDSTKTNYYVKFTPSASSTVSISSDGNYTTASAVSDLKGKTLTTASLTTKLSALNSSLTNDTITLKLSYGSTETTVTLDNSNSDKTVSDLVSAISSATSGAVKGKFDDLTGKFILETKDTGSSAALEIREGTDTELLEALGLSTTLTVTTDSSGNTKSYYASSQGKDAKVTITQPGGTVNTITQSSNNFTINGVAYSISGTTAEDEPISLSVTKDTSKMHDLISDFLDKYNEIIDKIQTKLSEKKDYDYSPLTDAQKEEMTDTQISKWEEKAKQGILRNDSNLENILTNLRQAFTSSVKDSNGNNVSTLFFGDVGSNSIGIDTSSDYSEGGKITIVDDDKFTEALTNNAEEVMKLFTTKSTSTDSTEKFNQSGIFQRISNIIQNNVGVIGTTLNNGTLTKYANVQNDYTTSGGGGTGTLPDQIYQKQLFIDKYTDLMNDHEDKYYSQFSALETALETLSAQQSVISSYFS
ncbi:flagellar filament capping protein FliD [Clostridium sp.]|uniref:flagellar filament capping protein FliD n=1 Tax=Clostridium sp. TaxID=1506 RepID=UPI0035A0D85D